MFLKFILLLELLLLGVFEGVDVNLEGCGKLEVDVFGV